MTDPIDTAALLALDAARTPGELTSEGGNAVYFGGEADAVHLFAYCFRPADALAIVAAVNALGPLCRRVEELERGVVADEMWHTANGEIIETLKSQLAAANARVAELEARLARFTPLFDPPVGCPSPE